MRPIGFAGTVAFAGAGGLANVSVVDTTALDLPALHLSGNLDLRQAVSARAAISSLRERQPSTAGAGDITLNRPGNDFNSVSVISGNNVVLNDGNAIDLGGAAISGNLTVTASGPITDSGALTIFWCGHSCRGQRK